MTELNIKSLEKLHLDPGDYVIAKMGKYCSGYEYQRIMHMLEKVFKKDIDQKGVKILLLEPGLEIVKLNVIKKEC